MPTGLGKNKFVWLLAGLAVLVGVLYVTPELLIWRKLASEGKPFVLIQATHHGDESQGTVSRFREIYDGHFPPGDLYLDSNAPSLFGPIQVMPFLMAVFLFICGGNTNVSYLLATFVLSPIVFLLFYWLGKVITGNRTYSVFFAMLGVMTPMFRALPDAFTGAGLFVNNVAKYFIPVVTTPLAKLPLGRTEDPLLTYLAFLPTIAALLLFWKKPNWKTGALAGGLIGFMFYIYFHYWVFLVIVAGLIGLFALARIKKDPGFFRSTCALWGVLLFVSIPYWINLVLLKSLPAADDVTRRIGLVYGRTFGFAEGNPPVLHYVMYLFLAALVYFVFFRRGQKHIAALYWLCIAAMAIIWNIQLVIGYVPSPDHWYRPIGAFYFVILMHALYELLKKVNYRTLALVLMTGSALLVAKKIVNAYVFIDPPKEFIADHTFESRTFDPGIVESWDWINKNLPHEPHIISPSFLTTMYLGNETSARPYLVLGLNTGASNALIEQRFLQTYKLFHVSPEFLKNTLEVDYRDMVCNDECVNARDNQEYQNTKENVVYLYFGYYSHYPGRDESTGKYRFISKEKADELIAAYPKVSVSWKDIAADYVYYGPFEKQIVRTDLSKEKNLELVYKNSDTEIYKIRR